MKIDEVSKLYTLPETTVKIDEKRPNLKRKGN